MGYMKNTGRKTDAGKESEEKVQKTQPRHVTFLTYTHGNHHSKKVPDAGEANVLLEPSRR